MLFIFKMFNVDNDYVIWAMYDLDLIRNYYNESQIRMFARQLHLLIDTPTKWAYTLK